jgi:threonine synthase
MTRAALSCRICEESQPLAPLSSCAVCGGPLDVHYDWDETPVFRDLPSMWRYGALLPHGGDGSIPGGTPLVPAATLSDALGIELHLKLESANPTHSFKDRLAATAVAAAKAFGLQTLCCASRGNLGDALASACAAAGLEAVVLTPAGERNAAARPAAYGAGTFDVRGTYEECRELERELEPLFPWGFLEGNLHAFAVEGAKTISYEIAEQLGGHAPDAVVSPLASGTLLSKLAQGFAELKELGLMNGSPPPRQFGAQPEGCPPVAMAWADERPLSRVTPDTVAHSLAVGDPRHGDLALGAARITGGSIASVPESRIASSTELLAETSGVYADTAGGVALGALLQLVRTGAIEPGARVVLVVTGSGVKPGGADAGRPSQEIDADAESFLSALGVGSG